MNNYVHFEQLIMLFSEGDRVVIFDWLGTLSAIGEQVLVLFKFIPLSVPCDILSLIQVEVPSLIVLLCLLGSSSVLCDNVGGGCGSVGS